MLDATVVVETGARARAASLGASPVPAGRECGEEIARLSLEDFDALVLRRVEARQQRAGWRTQAIRRQATLRAQTVLAWPAGRCCPLGHLREAWVTCRYGPANIAEAGAAAAGAPRPELAQRIRRSIGLYEAFAAQRPPGWPASGAGALCVLAAQRRADCLAGDVARLHGLARAMRAAALMSDPVRLARARSRAARRHAPQTLRFQYRIQNPTRRTVESAECRRERVRDALLLASDDPAAWPNAELASRHHPALRAGTENAPRLLGRDRLEELDGLGARAQRYREQLAAGVWRLPPGHFDFRPLNPKEAATE